MGRARLEESSSTDIAPNFSALPDWNGLIEISKLRVVSLIAQIDAILKKGACSSGEAATLWGRLGHASTQMWGQLGRAKLCPLVRREWEVDRFNLNPQFLSCLHCWRRVLPAHPARTVPRRLRAKGVIITYSDGEGGQAGVGVGLWHYDNRKPLAAYMRVPRNIRRLWAAAKSCSALERERLSDIFGIEAVGPLIILELWPRILEDELWIRFIDIVGAQMCFVKGSASCESPDEVVGLTWEMVARVRAYLFTDRVASADNPVDGLSRGRFEGPWDRVLPARLPAVLLERLQQNQQRRRW